jgi:hypothetical protein
MIDLKNTKEEIKKSSQPYIGSSDDMYPYGTRITLSDKELKKLGIKNMPAVGEKMMFEAKAKVISSHQSADRNSSTRRIELQITHMELEDEAAEKDDADERAKSAIAKKLDSM